MRRALDGNSRGCDVEDFAAFFIHHFQWDINTGLDLLLW